MLQSFFYALPPQPMIYRVSILVGMCVGLSVNNDYCCGQFKGYGSSKKTVTIFPLFLSLSDSISCHSRSTFFSYSNSFIFIFSFFFNKKASHLDFNIAGVLCVTFISNFIRSFFIYLCSSFYPSRSSLGKYFFNFIMMHLNSRMT